MLDDEYLAVRVSYFSKWKKKDPDEAQKMAVDLRPRANEEKSAWAYVLEEGDPTPEVVVAGVSDSLDPIRVVHAVALYVFSRHRARPDGKPASKVRGVGLRRSAVQCEVEDSPHGHVVTGLDPYHRHLTGLQDDEHREQVARSLAESGEYEWWQFTKADLAPYLRALLDADLIVAEYRPTATVICEEVTGS